MATLTLTLTQSETQSGNNTQFRLDINMVASAATIQNELLVIRRVSTVEAFTVDGVARDEFWGICRYVDISTLGVDQPDLNENFYLVNDWTLVFGNAETRQDAIDVLRTDTTKLSKEIKSYTDPANTDIIVFVQTY
jgi:hypothetical protein